MVGTNDKLQRENTPFGNHDTVRWYATYPVVVWENIGGERQQKLQNHAGKRSKRIRMRDSRGNTILSKDRCPR
jgi:hypothetical protein